MKIEAKILNGLERIADVLKSLLWEKAKVYGISPIQIQILLFVSDHRQDIANVSYLAKEFSVTKATISDAIKVLINKDLLTKDYSPIDRRRYNLLTTKKGNKLIKDLSLYSRPLSNSMDHLSVKEKEDLFKSISKLIFQLNRIGIIQVQRTCYNCRHYKGDKSNKHYCKLLEQKLKAQDLRLDCEDFVELLA